MTESFRNRIRAGAADFALRTVPAPVAEVRARGSRRQRRQVVASVAVVCGAVVVVGGVVAGFGRHGAGPGPVGVTPPPADTTSSASSAPSSTLPSTTTASTSTAAIPMCTASQVTVTRGRIGVGGMHIGGPLVFTNNGPSTCRLTGYPTVVLLDAAGKEMARAAQTPNGYLSGPAPGTAAVVDLAAGQSASAFFEGLDVTPDAQRICPTTPTSMAVTLPGDTRAVVLSAAGGPCGSFEVHPLVSGASGRSATAP